MGRDLPASHYFGEEVSVASIGSYRQVVSKNMWYPLAGGTLR